MYFANFPSRQEVKHIKQKGEGGERTDMHVAYTPDGHEYTQGPRPHAPHHPLLALLSTHV